MLMVFLSFLFFSKKTSGKSILLLLPNEKLSRHPHETNLVEINKKYTSLLLLVMSLHQCTCYLITVTTCLKDIQQLGLLSIKLCWV
jgi:hypothetical protein